MYLTDIRLQNYRSYTDASFELAGGVNIIVGPNASGKTNLLEAIIMIALGKSYRAKDVELVAHAAPWSRIDAHSVEGLRTVKLITDQGLFRKEFEIDDLKLKRLLLNRTVPTVLFEPDHLRLLHGSPERRREYMDNLLEQLSPGFTALRRNYKRALAQRNALLKNNVRMNDQLFVWDLRLSDLGGQIALHRNELITQISERIETIYQSLAKSSDDVQVSYESSCDVTQYGSSMLKILQANHIKDIERGFTSAGPHRDDMVLTLKGYPAQEAASRGEIRTLLLSLKIIELELIEVSRNQKPLLLLDDVFSELDGARRKALTDVIKGYQTFITTTDADVVVQHFTENCHIIPLG